MTTTLTHVEPNNMEAERTVLGALLIDPNAIFQVAPQLKADDFYDPVYKTIYSAIVAMMEQGTTIDFVTLADHVREDGRINDLGGSAYLAELANAVPTASHISHYAAIVRDDGRKRALIRAGRAMAALGFDEDQTADELTERAEQEFLRLSRQGTGHQLTRLGELRSQRFEHYVTRHESDDMVDPNTIQTGFADLDRKLSGLAPGELILIAGRPGMGKTSLALGIAGHAAGQNKVVGVFSLEMTKDQLFDRLVAERLGVAFWKLTTGALSDEEFDRLGTVLDELDTPPLDIDDDPGPALTTIRSKARRHQITHGLDLLIIDYLQLIEVTDRAAGDNQNLRIAYITKNLKQLARELHCPVILLSQLSRACEQRPDKRPQLFDLRDSGAIEQDGDKILMLYREGVYEPDCADPDCTHVFIRKHRNGATGQVELRFEKERMTFVSMDKGVSPQRSSSAGHVAT